MNTLLCSLRRLWIATLQKRWRMWSTGRGWLQLWMRNRLYGRPVRKYVSSYHCALCSIKIKINIFSYCKSSFAISRNVIWHIIVLQKQIHSYEHARSWAHTRTHAWSHSLTPARIYAGTPHTRAHTLIRSLIHSPSHSLIPISPACPLTYGRTTPTRQSCKFHHSSHHKSHEQLYHVSSYMLCAYVLLCATLINVCRDIRVNLMVVAYLTLNTDNTHASGRTISSISHMLSLHDCVKT